MNTTTILHTLALVLAAGGGSALAHSDCDGVFPATPPVTVTFLPVEQAPPLRTSVAQLSSRPQPHAAVDARVLGATTATRASSFLYRYRVVELEGGKVCVQPKIEVTLAYRPLVVEVASELAPGGCLHDVVLQHEQEHVKAYGEHLGTAARSLSLGLPQQLGPSVFHADDLAQAAAAIDAALDAAVEQAIQQELDKVRGSHEAIDTAEESERMYRVCGGALYGLWKKAERVASSAR